jgi:hypothetical protein
MGVTPIRLKKGEEPKPFPYYYLPGFIPMYRQGIRDKVVIHITKLDNHISLVSLATIARSIPMAIPTRFNTNHQDQL